MKLISFLCILVVYTACKGPITLNTNATPPTPTANDYVNSGLVSTFAGTLGVPGYANGAGTAAQFRYALGIVADSSGNVFVADAQSAAIKKITPAGVVSTFAGTVDVMGSTDGTGIAAQFTMPAGIAIDDSDNLFVTDIGNHTIRKITPAGVVTTVAGIAGVAGSLDGTGTMAAFNQPFAAAIDSSGNIFVADSANFTIRKITPAGVVTTFAGTAGVTGSSDGTGAAAEFNFLYGITIDSSGNLFVAEAVSRTIRKLTPTGVVTTFAGTAGDNGSADGTGPDAEFTMPIGITVDKSDNLFVSDANSIRKITPSRVVTTFAGTAGVAGSTDGVGAAAEFFTVTGITISRTGILYVSDSGNFTIRKIE